MKAVLAAAALLASGTMAFAADLELGPSVSHRDGGQQTDVTTFRNTSGETQSITITHQGVPTTAQVPPGANVTVITQPGSPQRPVIVIDDAR